MTRVLIVDDDDEIRLVLRFALEEAGYAVEEAPDGPAAVAFLASSPDGMIVLLDNLMPGMDGTEVLATLDGAGGQVGDTVDAGTGRAERHAFILLTASPHRVLPALAARLARLQAPIIAKPFDLDAITEAVAQASARLSRSAGTSR